MNRKKGIYVFMTALMLLGMGCTFASCGSDDDDDTQGNREVAELKAMLLDENGQVFFEAMGGSDYKIGLLSKEDAIDLIKLYVGSDFTGQPRPVLAQRQLWAYVLRLGTLSGRRIGHTFLAQRPICR